MGLVGSPARGETYEMSPKRGTQFERIVHGGRITLRDLLAGIKNLIDLWNKEKETLAENQGKEPTVYKGTPDTVSALGSSIIMLQFSAIEAIVNFLAEIICNINDAVEGAPKGRIVLASTEVDYLKEQRTTFDTDKGKLVIKRCFGRTSDKTRIFPLLLARLFEYKYTFEKKGNVWSKLQRLKETRDSLVHFRASDLDNELHAEAVKHEDLFCGSEALYWYAGEVASLVSSLARKELDCLVMAMNTVQHLAWMCLYDLRKGQMTEKDFDERYPLPSSPL
jgi:hypothetical protein